MLRHGRLSDKNPRLCRAGTAHLAAPCLLMGGEKSHDHPQRLLPANVAVPSLVFTAIQPDGIPAPEQTYAAPPPDTVLVPRQHRIHAQDQEQAYAALKLDKQAAEVARLTQALHDAKQMHAAEIERLRVQNAAEMQKIVEVLWQAQDAARAISAPHERATETPPLGLRPTSELQPATSPAGQARFMGWGALSLRGRACAALQRIGRRWATAFRAWS
jgi:hypothetical protein